MQRECKAEVKDDSGWLTGKSCFTDRKTRNGETVSSFLHIISKVRVDFPRGNVQGGIWKSSQVEELDFAKWS